MSRKPSVIILTISSRNSVGSTSSSEKESYDNTEDLEDIDYVYKHVRTTSDNESPEVSSNSNSRPRRAHTLYGEPSYHTPTSNQPSQQSTDCSNQQKYEVIVEDEDDQNFDDNLNQDNTQREGDKYNATVDDLVNEYKLYGDEYKEFKRQVDNVKSGLLEFIQYRTLYFKERLVCLNKKWDALGQLEYFVSTKL
ncbi:hypothetical protein MFLAVUS_009478 [Mucor flavus]|uniref:OCEL domain-containing protein n=1 Tax=Mucor flavus TaxID=439312 RepID=A0ABP9ZA03_9FUNG